MIKSNINKKKVMVVAGGEWQVPIIKKAIELGHCVINSNPHENSPGFKLADAHLIADVLDKESNLSYAIQYMPDAILTDQSDIAVPTVAYLCEKLNLPGIGHDISLRFTNKLLMRQQSCSLGQPNPDFKLCTDLRDVESFVNKNGYPIVIKPPASQSSRGVSKVDNLSQLVSSFELAKSFSSDNAVLVESFIPGFEITIDGIKTFSRHYSLATSTKKHYNHNPMVASDLYFSNNHDEFDLIKLHNQHDLFIEKLGLPFGLTHAEYKYYDGNFYLIEVAARGGGTLISSDIVPLMSSVDTNSLLIRMALGEKLDYIDVHFPKEVKVALTFFNFLPGKIKTIQGVEEALSFDGVKSIGVNLNAGDVIKPPEDDRSRHGYLIASANSKVDLDLLVSKVKNTVKVIYE